MREDWPTIALLAGCYAVWMAATTWIATASPALALVLVTVTTALHASLTHEVLHGHPFRNRHLNAALVFPALSLLVPYIRFRDTHLAHHRDERLTDPYDDPESNYLDPAVWAALPRWRKAVLRANNTLLGRMVLGPALSQARFMTGDLRLIRQGDRRVLLAWLWHVPAVALVVFWMLWLSPLPLWHWLACVYAANSLLRVRTFLEHRAHVSARGRTVIIEDRGPFAWLFLNNNLHVVHHMHPKLPWFRLPAVYRQDPDHFLRENHGYRYRSYAEVFARHLLRAKDPVPHPLWPRR